MEPHIDMTIENGTVCIYKGQDVIEIKTLEDLAYLIEIANTAYRYRIFEDINKNEG